MSEVPGPVDLAVIAGSGGSGEVVRACGAKGAGGIVIVSSGRSDRGSDSLSDTTSWSTARLFGMRLVGPECMGVINTRPEVRMNASVAEHSPPRGHVAFAAQSGGLGIALLGELSGRGLGVSSFVSLGDKADVSGNDLLRFWADDQETDVILLYLESFGNPRKFSRIARRVARKKPIVAVKSARTVSGRRGARGQSAVTVPDEAIDALFRQAGVIRVGTLEELLDVTDLLASQPLPGGRRVAIVGNAGGCGILTADACESYGLEVPELSAETQQELGAVVSGGRRVHNPVELGSSATVDEYRLVLDEASRRRRHRRRDRDLHLPGPSRSRASRWRARLCRLGRRQAGAGELHGNGTGPARPATANSGGSRCSPIPSRPRVRSRGSHPMPNGSSGPKGPPASFDDIDVARAREIVDGRPGDRRRRRGEGADRHARSGSTPSRLSPCSRPIAYRSSDVARVASVAEAVEAARCSGARSP